MAVPPASVSEADPQVKTRLDELTAQAHALRGLGTPESLRAAVAAYDRALEAAAQTATEPPEPEAVNRHASLWMKRGITLLTLADTESLTSAIASFDQALALRGKLPLKESPWYPWLLAAGWMNRADALTRLGSATQVREALRNYDLAIAHLQTLPLDAEPLFRWRLAVAWLNRGLSWQALNPPNHDQALRCFDNCIALFSALPQLSRLDDLRTLAAAWCNRANALLCQSAAQARAAAIAALTITRGHEESDPPMAEAGIKGRHILCRTLAELLEAPQRDYRQADAWILEATDAVEDSLQIIRLCEARGQSGFQPLLEDLFHFGARIYRAFQPHFLAEFLTDNQHGPFTEAMHSAAHEALNQAALQIRSEGLAKFNAATLERLLGTLAQLNDAAAQLQQSRPAVST